MAATPAVAGPPGGLARLAGDSERPVVVRRDASTGAPFFVSARVRVSEFSAEDAAAGRGRDFWETYGAAFGVRDAAGELRLRAVERDALGMTHLVYEQRHRGLPVFARRLLLHLDGRSVLAANGEFARGLAVPREPLVDAAGAAWAATLSLAKRRASPPRREARLLVYVDDAGAGHLAWLVNVPTARPLGVWSVFVDARTGEQLAAYDEVRTAARLIHDGRNDPDCNRTRFPACVLPGPLTAPPIGDADVDAAFTHAGAVDAYLFSTHGRDSYDGAGHPIRATVHFGAAYDNAFWCPDACAEEYGSTPDGEQVVLGDGDGTHATSLARGLDVVAHELVHGLTESTADLVYRGQSGALNESYSDVFAAMVDRDDWLIGEDVVPAAAGGALRSIAEPAQFGQPDHVTEFVPTVLDGGGVHVNDGIPNRAAYLAAEDPGFGVGRAAVERIYYRALTTYLTPSADFMANLAALVQSATDLYPGSAPHVRAIVRAHAAVGLADRPTVLYPNGGESLPTGSAATLRWLAGGDTGLPFRLEQVRTFGAAAYSQGFEAVAPGAPAPDLDAGGDAGWTVVAGEAGSGSRSLRSAPISHGRRAQVSLTRRLAFDGEVTFRFRVDSELGGDFFSFHVDGVPRLVEHGIEPWTTAAVFVPAGTHTFTWVYEKDEADEPPPTDDAAWIDDVVLPNVENAVASTVVPATSPGATSHEWTVPSATGPNYRLRVHLLGGIAPWLATDDSNGNFGIGVQPDAADTRPPTDPVLHSETHRPGVASRVRRVIVTWAGAGDEGSGVDGFSFAWSSDAAGEADTVKDAEESASQAQSALLTSGTHYFHLRTRDNEGNWSSGSRIGPFVIARARVCVVPNVRRKRLAAARAAIGRAGCRTGTIARARSARIARGRVVSQRPRPGTRVKPGTRVRLVVSAGRARKR